MARLVSDALQLLLAKERVDVSKDGSAGADEIIEIMLRAQNELGEGYCIIEGDRVIFLNAAFCRVCGYAPDEITGLDDLLRIAHPDARATLAARHRDRLAGRPVPDRYETVIVHKSGRRVPLEIAAHRFRSANRRYWILLIVRDISERRWHEAEREAALRENIRLLEELRRASFEQWQFLRDVLEVVTDGRLRLCESPEELPPPLASSEAAERFVLSPPQLARLRQRLTAKARGGGFTAERTYDAVLASSEAAGNAIVHATSGEATLRIDPDAGRLQVWVCDQGPGIALKHLHRAVLQRGFTTAGSLGHGFSLILSLSDRVFLLPNRLGTTLVLEFDRAAPSLTWEEMASAATGKTGP